MKKIYMMIIMVLVLAIAAAVFGDDKNQNNSQAADQTQAVTGTATAGTTATPKWDPARDLSPELQNALSTSHEGLREEPAPGGGIMVNLQGRFQHLSVLAVDAQGNLVPQCVSPGHDCSKDKTDKHSKDAKSGGEE